MLKTYFSTLSLHRIIKARRSAVSERVVHTASSTISGTTSRTFSDYYTLKTDKARKDCFIIMNLVQQDETDGVPKDSFLYRSQKASSHQMGTEGPFELNFLPLAYDSISIALCPLLIKGFLGNPSFALVSQDHIPRVPSGWLSTYSSQPFLYDVRLLWLGLFIIHRKFLLPRKISHLLLALGALHSS